MTKRDEKAEFMDVDELEADRRRIDETLHRKGISPAIEALLLREKHWVERRLADNQRFPIASWAALEWPGRHSTTVEVKNVSRGGILAELDDPPDVGTRVHVVFTGLDDCPEVDAIIRHRSPDHRRCGMEFQCDRETGENLCRELVRRFGVRPM